MASKPLRPVTGTFAVRRNAAPIPHEEGFRHALDKALNSLTTRGKWPPDVYRNVRVEFSATIEVVNPGHIVEYAATLVPSS